MLKARSSNTSWKQSKACGSGTRNTMTTLARAIPKVTTSAHEISNPQLQTQGSTMTIHLRTWGDFACFTRPEMKVERVSYPVITPSAARGVLEAIYWKPECTWRVREVAVL